MFSLLPVVSAWVPPITTLRVVRLCSKIVRKGIARVHTVYRQNIRTALRKKIENDGSNKKGKVRTALSSSRQLCGPAVHRTQQQQQQQQQRRRRRWTALEGQGANR
jgi:hypothetical protein